MAAELILLLLCAEPGDEPLPAAVYRSKAELPKTWAAALPKDFDFSKEMLAGTASAVDRVVVVSPQSVKVGKDGVVTVTPKPKRWCPPCRRSDRVMEDDFSGLSRKDKGADVPEVYRLPKSKGTVRVYEPVLEMCRTCGM